MGLYIDVNLNKPLPEKCQLAVLLYDAGLIFIVFRPTKNKMKLIIVVLCAFVALSAAELKWSEDGQYRLVETDPMFRWVATEPARYRYIDYGAAVPMSYRAMPLVGLRDYEPFVYSYSHIAK
ncbi:hypothetical protein evm_000459 [Chilo suppressalis]|nr:hypothetical protein evm_000459 [Chilo suppressalis]